MTEEIAEQFVATYYQQMFREPKSLHKFYDLNATLTRLTPSNVSSFILCMQPQKSVSPFDSQNSTAKIVTYHSHNTTDSLLVSVFGSITDNSGNTSDFTQQFILRSFSLRWYIISDVFFQFLGPNPDLFAAESPTEEDFPHPQSPKPSPSVQTFKPTFTAQPEPLNERLMPRSKSDQISVPQIRDQHQRKLYTYEQFDPTRSITVLNLTNNYNGEGVVDAFSQFGRIENKYFTHHTVYIEFELQRSAEMALECKPRISQESYAKVEEGIVESFSRIKI